VNNKTETDCEPQRLLLSVLTQAHSIALSTLTVHNNHLEPTYFTHRHEWYNTDEWTLFTVCWSFFSSQTSQLELEIFPQWTSSVFTANMLTNNYNYLLHYSKICLVTNYYPYRLQQWFNLDYLSTQPSHPSVDEWKANAKCLSGEQQAGHYWLLVYWQS